METQTASKFYLIRSEYVGPNTDQHRYDGKAFFVQTEPGRTNMSHEIKIEGWLGTTNDWYECAYGVFDSIEEAQKEAERILRPEYELKNYDEYDEWYERDETYVMKWAIMPKGINEFWEASDWLDANITKQEIEREPDLEKLCKELEVGAFCDGIMVIGLMEWLEKIRGE